jgi:hypothetical protein
MWTHRVKLTGNAEIPDHITRIKNGLLLSYGNRNSPPGVDVRFGNDDGTTWSDPVRVLDCAGDIGYPSSVQLPDGQVLTAYYAQRIAGHDRYHMGVVVWDPPRTRSETAKLRSLGTGVGAYAVDDNQPQPHETAHKDTAHKDSVAIPKRENDDVPPSSGAPVDKPRAVAREGVEYLQKLRKNTPFGAKGFDLEANHRLRLAFET